MKNKNFDPHKTRSYIIVFGLLSLSFLIVFGGLIFKSKLHPDYPLVFTDANNKLMFITKSNNSKNDIASITDANISYANNDTRYLLYTNNNSLYLLDTTIGGIGKKIVSNVLSYGFSKDDKFIYYIDKINDFYIYNRINEETIKIASNVEKIELIKDNIFIYKQKGNLVFQKLNETPIKVSDSYIDVEINKENKLLLYSVDNNNLKDYYVYDIVNNNVTNVLKSVTKLYTKDNNYSNFLYTTPSTNAKDISSVLKDDHLAKDKNFVSYDYEDYTSKRINKETYEANQLEQKNIEFRNQLRNIIKEFSEETNDLYYKSNNTLNLIASNIYDLYYYDVRRENYSYTSYSFENNALNIDNYKTQDDVAKFAQDFENLKLNTMYFKSGANVSTAYKNITSDAKVYLRSNNEYYLLVKNDNYYNLYFSKINNRNIKIVGEIDTNLLLPKLNTEYQDGYLYVNNINDHKYLNLVSDGRVRTLVEDINPEYYVISEGKDMIYYLKTTGEYINDLNVYNGIRTSTIAGDIYSFMYINNDLIYVTKNFDSTTKTSDLYRLDGNKLTLIYKDIADWYSPLKDEDKELEEEKDI